MNEVKPAQIAIIASPSQGKQATCICCRIKFDSVDLQRGHFKTEWHLYNLKRRICNLDPIDLDSFNEIQGSLPEKQDDETTSIFSLPSLRDIKYNPIGQLQDDDNTTLGDDWSEINEDEFVAEDYDDDEVDELLERVVKPDTCLFCNKKSSNYKQNVSHMNQIHGFFVPEEKYVIDFEGLMAYLGFKVGAGTTCLWCNKQFTTLHGVRLHMIYKNHCKILYDQEKAIEEFKEFYDYTNQEAFDVKPPNELVVHKRRPERRFDGKREMSRGRLDSEGQLILKKDSDMMANARDLKRIRRFDARQAKALLSTAMANNKTQRSRLRMQNPI